MVGSGAAALHPAELRGADHLGLDRSRWGPAVSARRRGKVRPVKAELERLVSDPGDFARFTRDTQCEWTRLARYLMRRWSTPTDVDAEDLVQEMLAEAWRRLPEYDPGRGKPLEQFVVWNAVGRAKKWLHARRSALRRDDRASSRHDLCLSSLDEDASRRLEPSHCPDLEGDVDRSRSAASLPDRMANSLDRALLEALIEARGDVDAAARRLASSPSRRWLYRIDGESVARAEIRRVMREAAALSSTGGADDREEQEVGRGQGRGRVAGGGA